MQTDCEDHKYFNLLLLYSAFYELIGDLNELKERDYGDEERGAIRYILLHFGTIINVMRFKT